MMQPALAQEVLQRLPLAEAVLLLGRWHCDAPTLNDLFAQHRGPCYTKELSFATLVTLIGDALVQHQGSGRQSFQRARENQELTVTDQAVYQKLGRLPLAVSEAFVATSAQRLGELVPSRKRDASGVPVSLRQFAVLILDGKAIKRVPKRLRPLRNRRGGVLGGKALVALQLTNGLAVAMATDPDGDTNEAKLVPALLPQVRACCAPILWVADRQFGDPTQATAFSARAGDHFLLRQDGKTKFYRDPARPVRRGQDRRGRSYEEEWGWLGSVRNQKRCYVRRITLERPDEEAIILVTDLLDAATYPAVDLLELYLARWGIERVFQQITEVFHLQRLIGTTPQGTVFQLAFCLLLYNLIQVVRAYVAEGAERAVDSVSSELLFEDVRRQLIALNEVVEPEAVVSLIPRVPTLPQLRQRLQELLHPLWTERWQKAAPKKRRPPHQRTAKREHASAYRLILQARLTKQTRVQT